MHVSPHLLDLVRLKVEFHEGQRDYYRAKADDPRNPLRVVDGVYARCEASAAVEWRDFLETIQREEASRAAS